MTNDTDRMDLVFDECRKYFTNERLREVLVDSYGAIPSYMHDGLVAYIADGYQPGNFLYCVLTNDLRGAVNHADGSNRAALADYVVFLTNNAPAACWCSEDKVTSWLEAGDRSRRRKT